MPKAKNQPRARKTVRAGSHIREADFMPRHPSRALLKALEAVGKMEGKKK